MELKKKDLLFLLDIIKTRSFSASAMNLSISQASLSKSVSSLEAKFGVSLLDRTVRPVTPSIFCVELIPYIERIIKAYDDLESNVILHKKNPSGIVNIYCPIPFQVLILQEIIPLIRIKYPEIKMSIKTIRNNINDSALGALFVEDCDILISFTSPRNEQLISRKLLELNCNIYAKRDFFSNVKVKTLKDIKHENFILHTSLQRNVGTNEIPLKKMGGDETLTVTGNIICDNAYSILNLTNHGLGLGYLPEIIAHGNSNLIKVLPDGYSSALNVFINYSKKEIIPLRNSIVIDFILDYFKSFDIDSYMSDFAPPI